MTPHVRAAPGPGASSVSEGPDPALKVLHTRIAAVAAIVVAELWNLTAALEAWAEGRTVTLGWLVGLQCVAFLLAVLTWQGGARPAALQPTYPVSLMERTAPE